MKRASFLAFVLGPLLVWAGYAGLAHRVALTVSQRWGQRILVSGDGKFSDVAAFVQHRLYEGAWLITLAIVLTVVVMGVGVLFAKRLSPLWKWVSFSLAGFVGANVWLKFAFGTCLFWCLFWNGKGSTNNLTQFHIKLLLLNENAAAMKVVLAGSSQVRAQIDPRLLNHQFGSNIFTTELHFPGNRSYDFLLLNHKLEGHPADAIVCYLSEFNFFDGSVSDGSAFFFSARDLPEFLELAGKPAWSPRSLVYGLLGQVLPVFWLRDAVAERSLGVDLTGMRQRNRDASLDSDLNARAIQAGSAYRGDDQSEFCFHAFAAFVEKCRTHRRTVVACCGQLNPVLARQLNPALRLQMRAFLHKLAAENDNFILLDEDALPPQTESDYEDLTHVNAEAQVRFTKALEPVLQKLLIAKQLAAGKAPERLR